MKAPDLRERLSAQPYQGYAYAYPHKTAYRRFERPIPLRELWEKEDQSALFLYLHLPFCEMRCGFCNLFTTANPDGARVERYLQALEMQMEMVAECLGSEAHFARAAFGGGTPSFLSVPELDRLFDAIAGTYRNPLVEIPVSFELSPETTSEEKLALLRERGVTRVSIGVQSFLIEETKALGRPQKLATVLGALNLMRSAKFRIMNLDLIYGVPGQSEESWRSSLKEALQFRPEEIYLYPLYIRPLTGLERLGREPGDNRLALYRAGRDFLLSNGYRQISMRLFRRVEVEAEPGAAGPVYCCQEDGMLGLGAGARSYTRNVHYSSEYAVGRRGVDSIIDAYCSAEDHRSAFYGCRLSPEEERRRFVIKSILRADGLSFADYRGRFGCDPVEDFPDLCQLEQCGAGEFLTNRLVLNAYGLERSDSIGPWLFSTAVSERMAAYQFA